MFKPAYNPVSLNTAPPDVDRDMVDALKRSLPSIEALRPAPSHLTPVNDSDARTEPITRSIEPQRLPRVGGTIVPVDKRRRADLRHVNECLEEQPDRLYFQPEASILLCSVHCNEDEPHTSSASAPGEQDHRSFLPRGVHHALGFKDNEPGFIRIRQSEDGLVVIERAA